MTIQIVAITGAVERYFNKYCIGDSPKVSSEIVSGVKWEFRCL